jgi:ribonuclease HII
MGIDEAGRGPLAGPVVVAAAIVPTDLPGVIDSKQIKDEEDRERTYAVIMASPGVRWALAVVDAPTIDEINILQATLLGMRMAALALVSDDAAGHPIVSAPCVSIRGCYVVRGFTDHQGQQLIERSGDTSLIPEQVYALVDGNRLPQQMPCRAEPIVKGDSKEYSIAAASILAKVTRDRLMRGFSDLYPAYRLSQHKGYPTAAHVAAIRRHGACPIHRRTFAPIKHMDLEERGQLLGAKPCASERDSSKKRRRRAAAARGLNR